MRRRVLRGVQVQGKVGSSFLDTEHVRNPWGTVQFFLYLYFCTYLCRLFTVFSSTGLPEDWT